jgi:hypothetical protein
MRLVSGLAGSAAAARFPSKAGLGLMMKKGPARAHNANEPGLELVRLGISSG